MNISDFECGQIVELAPQEIDEIAGGPVPALWLIGAGLSAVGLFAGGVNMGLSVGSRLQG